MPHPPATKPKIRITAEALGLARLLRICDDLELPTTSKEPIYQALVAQCQMVNNGLPKPASPQHELKRPAKIKKDQAVAGGIASEEITSQLDGQRFGENHYAELLRNKVNEGAEWQELKDILRRWWLHEPSLTLSGKILEMSYVWSGSESFLEVLPWFHEMSAWQSLHEAIRSDILRKYHKDPRLEPVITYLTDEALAPWLLGCERLLVVMNAARQKDHGLVFKLHTRFASQLKETLVESADRFGIQQGDYKYQIAVARLEQGYLEEAMAMVKTILPSEGAYQPASKLKRRILAQKKSTTNSQMHSKIIQEVVARNDWDRNEQTFRYYLEKMRTNPGSSQGIVSIMNELLIKDLVVPMDLPGALSRYVGMCLEYFDLYEMLPNILSVLTKNACVFHPPAIDGAIWNHFLSGQIPDFPCDPWRAVALFHRFMAWGLKAEDALWQSYDLMKKSRHNLNYVMDVDFEDLKTAALKHLSSSPLHDRTSGIKALLEICTDDKHVDGTKIENYLTSIRRPKYQVISRLYQIAHGKKLSEYCHKIIHVMVQNGFLLTSHMKYYLSMTMQSQQPDLAWRISTLLIARSESLGHIEQLWQVSGENRKIYHMTPMEPSDLEGVLTNLVSSSSWKVFSSLLSVGSRIPELISHASYQHHVTKWKSPQENSLEERILRGLNDYPWLKKPPKRVADHPLHSYAAAQIPEAENWILSPYSLCVSYLMEYLGLISIRGDLLRLRSLVTLTTQTDHALFKQNPTKRVCVKWYKSLSAKQRIAWLDICRETRKKIPLELSQDMVKLSMRLAVMMMPGHYEALKTLQRLKVPLIYLRDIEAFMLSDGYGQFRQERNIHHKVPIPSYPSIHSHLGNIRSSVSLGPTQKAS